MRAVLPLALRSLLLELADEAHAAGIPSLRFVAGRASAPSLPRVLQAALLCCERGVLDAGAFASAALAARLAVAEQARSGCDKRSHVIPLALLPCCAVHTTMAAMLLSVSRLPVCLQAR